jgi:hypothetical protein
MFNPIRTAFNLLVTLGILTVLSFTHLKAFEVGFRTGTEPSVQNTAIKFVLSNFGGK